MFNILKIVFFSCNVIFNFSETGTFTSFPEHDNTLFNRFYYLTGRKVIKRIEELEFEELSYLRFRYSNYSVWNESLRYNLNQRMKFRKPRGYYGQISELVDDSTFDFNKDYEYESSELIK